MGIYDAGVCRYFFKSTNIDKDLRHMYEKNKYKLFFSLAKECANYLDGNNARILAQAIDSFLIGIFRGKLYQQINR